MTVPEMETFLNSVLDEMGTAGLLGDRDRTYEWLHTVWLAAQGRPYGVDADVESEAL